MLGVMADRTRGNGVLAHPLWNSENVDFSSVAGIFGVEGHKGAKTFPVGFMAAPTRGQWGTCPPPLELRKG